MSYATPADVEVELGRPASSPAETAQWQAWLDRVERAIERAFRRAGLDLTEQIALSDPPVDDVVDVEVAAVIRKIQNPTWGRTSRTVSRQVDDASISETDRAEGVSGDPLDLLSSEISQLLPAGNQRAFSFTPYRERCSILPHGPWV